MVSDDVCTLWSVMGSLYGLGCFILWFYPSFIVCFALFIVKVKFDGTPMRIYAQGTLYPSAEVVVRAVTAFAQGGERVTLSPKLAMPTKNEFILIQFHGWRYMVILANV